MSSSLVSALSTSLQMVPLNTRQNANSSVTGCPLISCYIAFSVDCAASVNHLEDSEATAAAQKIKAGTYIGYVDAVCLRLEDSLLLPESYLWAMY
jgi:hypothetical protein